MNEDELKDLIDSAAIWEKEKPESRTVLLIAQDKDEDPDVSYFLSGGPRNVLNVLTQVFIDSPGFKELVLDAVMASDAKMKTQGRPAN